jgi:hypothetical protein
MVRARVGDGNVGFEGADSRYRATYVVEYVKYITQVNLMN